MAKENLEWKAFDHIHQKHSADWYWAGGIITLSIAATAIIFNNILFAVLVVISSLALFLRTLQKPRKTHYALTSRGFHNENDFTPYSTFESFYIDDTHGKPKLLLKGKNILSPLLIIPLGEMDTENVQIYLARYLLETELREPLSKKIMEFLGF